MWATESVRGLAVVGMGVSSPKFNGVAGFGRYIYRGTPLQGGSCEHSAVSLAQTIEQALEDAGLSSERTALITLSPMLDEELSPAFVGSRRTDLSSEVNPTCTSLKMAKELLVDGDLDAVVIAERQTEAPLNSVIVIAALEYARAHHMRVYAAVSGFGEIPVPINRRYVEMEYKSALAKAALDPDEIGLFLTPSFTANGINSLAERGLLHAFDDAAERSCALGRLEPGLVGLVQAVWCVYWRVIPGMLNWEGFASSEDQNHPAFYVPLESRTWFSASRLKKRAAGCSMTAKDGSIAFLFLREERAAEWLPEIVSRDEGSYLFPIAASTLHQLEMKIRELQQGAPGFSSLAAASNEWFNQFANQKNASSLIVCLLAKTAADLVSETSFALKGLPGSLEKMQDWQTPLGSYFTPAPLGECGGVAFVYPGGFNAYPGVGQDLFYLFPGLYDRFEQLTAHVGKMLCEKQLYPRSLAPISRAELSIYEERLISDPLAMLNSGTSLAVLYTLLLRDIFMLKAESAFGYSLGEISMLFASHVWTAADDISAALSASELFKTRLAGPQNAIRSYWSIPSADPAVPECIWENHLLIAAPEVVREVIMSEPHVYLTHINTPGQVVIGGDPQACRRVIKSLKAHSIKAPFEYAIHNPAMQSEYESMIDLFRWPIEKETDWTLYFSAANTPEVFDQSAVAHLLADGLCSCLDFPRLVQRAYQGGARVFIELGAGSSCARWVHDSLKGQPHAAFSINQKGGDEYASLLKLFARLVSHRVPIDISSLYRSDSCFD